MTENKRFTTSDTDVLCMTIIDNENGKHYGFARDIAIVMNDINDENMELQKENEELKREIKKFKKLWADTFMENAELKEKLDKSSKRFVKKLNTIQKQWG